MDDRLTRLQRWERGEQPGPYQIEIHPTNRCNMDCVMCGTMTTFRKLETEQRGFRRRMSKQWEMPDKRFFELVEEAAKMDVQRWLITGGGEPFMRRKATLGMVKRIKQHGMYGNLNTNGTLLMEKDVLLFVESGWDMVMFSIDSHSAEAHDSIRRLPNSFKLAERTMRAFKRIKQEMETNTPKIVFNTVLTNRNYQQLDKILEYCASVGGEDVTFIPLIDFVPTFDIDLKLNGEQRDELRSLIPIVKERGKQLGVNTNIDTIVPEKIADTGAMDKIILLGGKENSSNSFASLPCYEPYLNLVIRMTGAVGPCCMLEDRSVSVRDRSLGEVWEGPFFQRIRKSMEQQKLFDACKNCVYMQIMGNTEVRQALQEGGGR